MIEFVGIASLVLIMVIIISLVIVLLLFALRTRRNTIMNVTPNVINDRDSGQCIYNIKIIEYINGNLHSEFKLV